jgi:phenylpropionate dioxygenase-like ring-hydroxylating dioxygenase large terminal subunit
LFSKPVGLGQNVAMAREIPDPDGIRSARTLPAAWYADASHHLLELDRVFRGGWVCVGVVDELPAPGAWTALRVGGTPVLLVRDRAGELRGFLNVCRHRAAPLCDDHSSADGPLIRCPYHAWLYRLDGSLARASGVGDPDSFDLDDHALTPVQVTTWRRMVFVNVDAGAEPFAPGPLGAAIDAFAIEDLELVVSERHERRFNWKVLLENYSENYHTPFVHPEIDTTATEDYPMVSDGIVLYAWDRPLRPVDDTQRIMHDLLPGEPGWESLGAAATSRPYDVGNYLTVWPNLMMNVFPDAALVMWMEPVAANVTVVERRMYLRPGTAPDVAERIVASHRLVHQQDVDICTSVQRSHDAGLDANGRLATFEERGVYFVHQHVRAAVGESTPVPER